MKCPFCSSEIPEGSIRCVSCQRMLGGFQGHIEEKVSDKEREMLDSWQMAQARVRAERDRKIHLLSRAETLVIDALVVSMSAIATICLALYIMSAVYPPSVYWLSHFLEHDATVEVSEADRVFGS